MYVILNVFGIPCDDITTIGRQDGAADVTMKTHFGFVAESKYVQEDLVFVGCTPNFDAESMAGKLEPTHSATHVFLDPRDTGDNCARRRSGLGSVRDETV